MNQTTGGAVDHSDGSYRVVEMTVPQLLTVFTADIDLRLEELRASVAIAEAQALIKKAICAAFPETLPLVPKSLTTANVYRADASLVFEFKTRDQVLALLEALPGVPVVLVKAGCTTFVPEERYVEDDSRNTKVLPVSEVSYRLSTWCGRLQEEFTWWTRLAGKLVRVEAKTKEGTQVPVQVSSSQVHLSNNEIETTWNYAGLPCGALMHWSGGDTRNVVPISVHQLRGGTLQLALSSSQSTTAKVTKSCHC